MGDYKRKYHFHKFFSNGAALIPWSDEKIRNYILHNGFVSLTSYTHYPVFYEWILPALNTYHIKNGNVMDILIRLYRIDPITTTLLLHYLLKTNYDPHFLYSNSITLDVADRDIEEIEDIIKLVYPFMPYRYRGVGDRGYHAALTQNDLVIHSHVFVMHRAILRQIRRIFNNIGVPYESFWGLPCIRIVEALMDHGYSEYYGVIAVTHIIYATYEYNSIYTQI